MTLAIDIETYSSVEIKKSGVFKYVESPDFEILLIAYQYDDGPVNIIDLATFDPDLDDTAELEQLKADLINPAILKTAYNAQFEITCLSKSFCPDLDPYQWRCTMVRAAMVGLPFGLDFVARVLDLPVQKLTNWQHIKYFCVPCKPTKTNDGRTRNRPYHNLEMWNEFKEYCKQDVRTERAIDAKIDFYQPADFEKPMYGIDQLINKTGVKIDRQLVQNAIKMDKENTDSLIAEAIRLSGVQNPKSVQQLKRWIEEEIGEEIDDLQAKNIPGLIDRAQSKDVKRILHIRQQISKSSIKKYQAMVNCAGADDRVRGLFQYYGANRTGRWAGRLVQVQNLVKNNMKGLDLARELVKDGDLDTLQLMFGNVSGALSQLCRTAFIPEPGKKFIVSDFSAIEARVIAWLAGEQWRLDVFNSHGKIYEASGAAMFKVPIEQVTKGSKLRDKAKIAELALGYQGGVNALLAMGAEGMGLTKEELPEIVKLWRSSNQKIVKLWHDVNNAVISCVETRQKITVSKVTYHLEKGVLFCTLPSGRRIAYMRPKLVPNDKFGGWQVEYEGMNQTTKKWEKIRAYGGLFVENITQAIARDLLAQKIKDLVKLNYNVVMHVHDEVVLEEPEFVMPERIDEIMSHPVSWAAGLPLKGDGFETYYYKKEN